MEDVIVFIKDAAYSIHRNIENVRNFKLAKLTQILYSISLNSLSCSLCKVFILRKNRVKLKKERIIFLSIKQT